MSDAQPDIQLTQFKKSLSLIGFLRGMIFWYGIEKLFQIGIGFSIRNIIILGIIGQASKIFFELPTSVYADRWSRRNTLIAANACMAVCCLVLGLSTNFFQYAVGVLIWALGDALNSGVHGAFIYDSLALMGHNKQYRKVYTRVLNYEFFAIGATGALAGIIAHFLNFRVDYLITIIPALLCIQVLLKLNEPTIHRTTSDNISWIHHISGALKLMNDPKIRWPIAIFIVLIGFQTLWYENYQLLGIQVKVPSVIFGLLISIVTAGLIIGAEIAHRYIGGRKALMATWLTVILTHSLGLRLHSLWFFLVNLLLVFIGIRMLYVYLEVYVQDNIKSGRRATIISLASTMAYVVFFLLAAGFVVFQKMFGAVWAITLLSLPLLFMGLIDTLRGLSWSQGE